MNFFAQKSSVVDSALEYASHGFKVFPAHFIPADTGPGQISPLCSGGRNAATADEKQIRQWWASFPDALIAIPTGGASGLLAVTTPQNSPLNTKTPVFSTFSGENCYIFQFPSTGEKPACGTLDGGGSFHGEGGFIVVPPSALAYKNAENEEISGCYSVIQDGEIVGAPLELLQKIRKIATVERMEKGTVTPTKETPDIFRAVEKRQEQEEEEQEEEPDGLPALPMECLPSQLRAVIEGVSQAYCVDHWLPFAAALRTAATIVEANVILEHSNEQTPGALWLCLIARSGACKTKVTRFFNDVVFQQQKFYRQSYKEAMKAYKNALEEYETAKNEAQKKKESFKEKEPEIPYKTTLYVDDITPESLITMLCSNPGGVIWDCDEIRTLLNSFGRYGGKGSGEAAKTKLLSLYSGANIAVNRKGNEEDLAADKGWLSIFGTVQPSILPKIFDKDDRGSGFLQRFMFIKAKKTSPVPSSKRPNINNFKQQINDIFNKMFMDVPRLVPGDDESKPVYVRPDRQGREMLDDFFDELENQAYYLYPGETEEAEEAQSRLGRWQEQLPRLVLLMHCFEKAEKGSGIGTVVSAQTIEKTIHIFRALMEHTKTTWKIIKNEKVKTAKSFDIIDIIDKYVDKSKEIYEIRYADRVQGKKIAELILKAVGAATDSIGTRQALSKALEETGFSKKEYAGGTKFVIKKDVYQFLLKKIEKKKEFQQKEFVPTPPAPKNDFFRELTEGMGVESF